MKKRILFLILSCVMTIPLILTSCSKSTITSSTISTLTPTASTATNKTITSTVTNTASTTTAPTTTAVTGNWWDKLGTPQYGGTMTLRSSTNIVNFDPYGIQSLVTIESAWMERLFADDWTLDPTVYNYMTPFRPNGFEKGQLASSWEFTDPTTLVVHLRQGIHWQNIPPANGREFVASDVVFHFMRMYDQKKGTFTNVVSHTVKLDILQSVTATDKYTVVFKWNTPNQEFIYEGLMVDGSSEMCMENPEAVQQWGDLSDWHHAIGTGPFILTDYVSNSSATLIKNPNYWGYDERYPQNTLPYINEIKILIIPDNATALAGLRTGKIDELDGMSIQTAQDMQKTNPEISQIGIPTASSTSLACRVDVAPYNDIRVRQALQMAINLPEIAQSYYLNSCDPNPLTHFSKLLKGYSFPYDDWPQDLKDQYAYNPTQAKQLLAAAGYPNGFNTDIVAANTWDGDLLQVIKSYFAAVGINMEIRTMDAASYNAFVKLGWKQDALAADANLGLMYEPMMCFNFCRTVDVGNYYRINDPVADAFYPNAMAATSVDGVQKITRAFDEYIARQHWSVSLLEPNTFTFVQPWLKGYSGQDDSLYGSRGPSLMFFYPARFWIDQNLKKNLG